MSRSKKKPAAVDVPFAPPQWPAAVVEMRKLSAIVPYPKNPRTHTPEQIDLIAKSMKANGVTMPILVDEVGEIIAGHGRRLGAIANGFEEYPVVVARGWSEEQKRAVRIQDNQLGALSGWDRFLLRAEASDLKLSGYEVAILGFDTATLGWLTGGDVVTDAAGEWDGMPHFDNPDAKAFRSVVVHFHDQAGVDAFAKAVKLAVSDKTKFLWYPEIKIKPFVKYTAEPKKKARNGAGARA